MLGVLVVLLECTSFFFFLFFFYLRQIVTRLVAKKLLMEISLQLTPVYRLSLIFYLGNVDFCFQATELELSGYVSDSESPVRAAGATSSLDSQGFPLQTGEAAKRSVSDWVRSAQAILQTPQRPITRKPKTPEDSAKKKRKFQRFLFMYWFNNLFVFSLTSHLWAVVWVGNWPLLGHQVESVHLYLKPHQVRWAVH